MHELDAGFASPSHSLQPCDVLRARGTLREKGSRTKAGRRFLGTIVAEAGKARFTFAVSRVGKKTS